VIDRDGLAALIRLLRAEGRTVIGPRRDAHAIRYDEIGAIDDLPAGWGAEQEAGRYRLQRRDDAALFAYAVGPDAWKRWLWPPSLRLWRARRDGTGFTVEAERHDDDPPLAFLGVRGCDLAAIGVLGRAVAPPGSLPDPLFARRREAVIVAVECGHPAATCFCTSMGTGPGIAAGFDLALTELVNADGHRFLLRAGSARGAALAARLPVREATAADEAARGALLDRARGRITRRLETDGLKDRLQAASESPHWDKVAARCLACANCTLVCPTCFCTTIEDATDLAGVEAERSRRWDSCFDREFSALHGGAVRGSIAARYRQWLTHKLAHWHDQFGSSGCVGCGRCIAWCPVGIDITAEAAAAIGHGGPVP